MRSFLLFCVLLLPSFSQVLTQSVDNQTVILGNTLGCLTPPPNQFSAAMSFWRSYDLSALPLPNVVTLTSVSFTVEIATSLTGQATQPLSLRIYTELPPSGFPNLSGLTLLQQTNFDLPNGQNFRWRQTLSTPITVNNFEVITVELSNPDGILLGNLFLPGSNFNGESAPSYLSAAGCGAVNPTPYSLITTPAPVVHLILDLHYSDGAPTIALSEPQGAGGGLEIRNDQLIPGGEYLNVFSLTPCSNGPGTGPFLGLCGNSLLDFLFFLSLPPNSPPLRFTATSDQITWPLIPGLPSGVPLEMICVNISGATLVAWSPVAFYVTL